MNVSKRVFWILAVLLLALVEVVMYDHFYNMNNDLLPGFPMGESYSRREAVIDMVVVNMFILLPSIACVFFWLLRISQKPRR